MILMLFAGMLAILASITGPALGRQTQIGTCNSQDSIQGEFFLSPQSGPAGSTVDVSGSFAVMYGLDIGGGATEGAPVPAAGIAGPVTAMVWMDSGEVLAELPTDIDQNDIASFSGTIMIPSDAASGNHDVGFLPQGYIDPACLAFQVTEAVSRDAYVQTANSLPATGLTLMAPAAGLLALGSGALVRRSRRVSKNGRKGVS
ncbi:MAG: LPXTG cell wall anchor domain-containing protein [Actinobacteria bacterium]|nr:LPXTG cell wall anchor domain-containing protein [Actinomycetota bacterium]